MGRGAENKRGGRWGGAREAAPKSSGVANWAGRDGRPMGAAVATAAAAATATAAVAATVAAAAAAAAVAAAAAAAANNSAFE